MQSTAFSYESIPKIHKNRSNKFLLAYLILILLILFWIYVQIPALFVIFIYACLFLRIYEVIFSPYYLRTFAKGNKLIVYDYPKLEYSELPFFNKIYTIASVSCGIRLQQGPPLIEIFTYTTGPLWRTKEFQVVHIKLTHKLPNIIIDGKGNDYRLQSDLPATFKDITDEYTLEGDFPKYFRVYADAEKPVETLQLLSPELMATFIDNFSDFNIEFINESVFITTRTRNVTRTQFKRLIESSLELSDHLNKKAIKTLRLAGVYEDRISGH